MTREYDLFGGKVFAELIWEPGATLEGALKCYIHSGYGENRRPVRVNNLPMVVGDAYDFRRPFYANDRQTMNAQGNVLRHAVISDGRWASGKQVDSKTKAWAIVHEATRKIADSLFHDALSAAEAKVDFYQHQLDLIAARRVWLCDDEETMTKAKALAQQDLEELMPVDEALAHFGRNE